MARKTKSESQRQHARTRARQRYGALLTEHDFDRIISCVIGEWGNAELLQKQSLRVSIWKVPYKEWEFIAVYDRQRKQIATFLPPDSVAPFGAFSPAKENVEAPLIEIPEPAVWESIPEPVPVHFAPPSPKLGGSGRRKGVALTPTDPKPWTRSDTPRRKPYKGPSLTVNLASPLCPHCGEIEIHHSPPPVMIPALMALGRQFLLWFLIFALAAWALQEAGLISF